MKIETNNNEILVSVSMITYNHENFIRQAIEGVLMQQCNFPFEVLIHDDASTDNTQAIIKEYETKYPDIIKPIYQTENQYSQGVKISATFNLPRAKGKYIAMCEGDDYWTDPLKLQKQVDFLEANPDYSLVAHEVEILFDDEFDREILFTTKDLDNIEDVATYFYPTCSMVFRSTLINKESDKLSAIGVMSGDKVMLYKAFKYGKLKLLNEKMGVYRKHKGGISFNNKNYQTSEVFQKDVLFYQALDVFYERKHHVFFKKHELVASVKLTNAYWKTKKYGQFAKSFIRSLGATRTFSELKIVLKDSFI